ncbi:glycosyltransferase [Dokdonella soli]|uniref:glycosyltransferase n=1 Tax=Dokdonella soli TaxID=529810 RepID=UPI0031DFE7A1
MLETGSDDPHATAAFEECRYLADRSAIWQSANRTITESLARLNACARGRGSSVSGPIHIVCKLDTIGGTERRALNLYRSLSPHADVTLWSTQPAMPCHRNEFPVRHIAAGDAPAGGTLVLVGTYFACEAWLEASPFERVVICHNLAEQYANLASRLRQIEANPSRPRVELTFPSGLFQQTVGLPGRVEYSPVDMDAFRPERSRRVATGRLVIGRHGRAYPLKFHPNDPSFFRAVMARGHRVRVLGGTAIAPAFAHDRAPLPDLLAVGAESARDFLGSLDVFLYRKHPELFETCGTVITEAMAMELPVIVFAEQCGASELIEHGDNGFLVHSETEAMHLIDRLAEEPALRERVGRSARATIVELMRRQESAVIEYYLDGRD